VIAASGSLHSYHIALMRLPPFWVVLQSGPFKSRETGSGSGFVKVRIGFVHCRLERGYSMTRFVPMHAPIGCGVLSVECCVSGAFFREYPQVNLSTLPTSFPCS
jgi:hypothetical protein